MGFKGESIHLHFILIHEVHLNLNPILCNSSIATAILCVLAKKHSTFPLFSVRSVQPEPSITSTHNPNTFQQFKLPPSPRITHRLTFSKTVANAQRVERTALRKVVGGKVGLAREGLADA